MLLRDLKRIIHEAEEPNAAATETSQTPTIEKTLNKPQKTADEIKQASDGIGKESYKMSKELETKLSVSLKDLLNIKTVKASNNSIKITFDFSKSGQDIFLLSGNEISQTEMLDLIKMEITALLGSSNDEFTLDAKYFSGMVLIIVRSNIETSND
jgi:hypothetical protein